ncbi:hypothetical protein [Gordonia sihwensis]|uniref:hypothetical protein n=1 Tax=Gordonia sihwensis TaxID=173559 RepID=UPI003D998B99
MIEGHEYLWTGGGAVLYVGREPGFYQFRVFIGTLGRPLREIVVESVERMRDGGTTYISTAEGILVAPKPAQLALIGESYPSRRCTFSWSDGRPSLELPRADPDDYSIMVDETAAGIVVTVDPEPAG